MMHAMRKPLVALIVLVYGVGWWHAMPAFCAPQKDSPQERLAHRLHDGTLTIQMVPRDGAQAVDYALQYLRPLGTAQNSVMFQYRLWGDPGWRHPSVAPHRAGRITGTSPAQRAKRASSLAGIFRAALTKRLLPRVRGVAGRAILAADSMLASERARDPAPLPLFEKRSDVSPHRDVMPLAQTRGHSWTRLPVAMRWSGQVKLRIASCARAHSLWLWHGLWAAWLQGRAPPASIHATIVRRSGTVTKDELFRKPGEKAAGSVGMLRETHRAESF